MDPIIVSLIIAIVAIVPGVMALISQAKKDRVQSGIDVASAAQTAILAIVEPLKSEVTRLQARVAELEETLAAKVTEMGNMRLANIDKDVQIRTMQVEMQRMTVRLTAFEEIATPAQKKKMGLNIILTDEETGKMNFVWLTSPESEEVVAQKAAIKEDIKSTIEKLKPHIDTGEENE
jgi:uncharacterized coiled-coil protein SlyX